MENKIYGCILGGWCADAAGATLEFSHKPITEQMAETAMKMPGGGAIGVGPGQITDDSELEIAILNGLVRSDTFGSDIHHYPLDLIAEEYIFWINSYPFDIGSTCSNAFSGALNYKDMMRNALKLKNLSQANGSLMRAGIIGVWARACSDDKIFEFGKLDAQLSHCSEVCQEVNGLYCLIIAKIINGVPVDEILNIVSKRISNGEVKEWFDQANSLANIDCKKNIGYCKHGFQLVIYFLRNPTSYVNAIKTTLHAGGDTDTNAKIVGNVVGAMVGINKIPEYMLVPVINFDCVNTEVGHPRPKKYNVSKAVKLIKKLL